MVNKISTIFNKLESLEKELQRLKVKAFFDLPKKKQKYIYPEKLIRGSIRNLRKTIWQERYAQKI